MFYSSDNTGFRQFGASKVKVTNYLLLGSAIEFVKREFIFYLTGYGALAGKYN